MSLLNLGLCSGETPGQLPAGRWSRSHDSMEGASGRLADVWLASTLPQGTTRHSCQLPVPAEEGVDVQGILAQELQGLGVVQIHRLAHIDHDQVPLCASSHMRTKPALAAMMACPPTS